MQTLFSTDGVPRKDSFQLWRDVCEDRLVPMAQRRLDDGPFDAQIDGVNIGSFSFTKFSLLNVHASTTPQTIRHCNNKGDHLFLSMCIAGAVSSEQNDRSIIANAGDFSLRDTNTPWKIEHSTYSEVIAIGIPRNRIEGLLGNARRFAGLKIDGHHPVTSLARDFLLRLMALGEQLQPHAAERMVDIGADLIIASLAERMALEAPKSSRSTIILQRAIAFISANISKHDLDPALVAVAVGVSLRNLQQIFREDGRNIAAMIWQERLGLAARRLSDPNYSNLSLGEIAYGCGFMDHAHFSRRFRDRFGMSPRDYRQEKL